MADLHTAIREQLDAYVDEGCGYSGHECRVTGHDEMKAALLAVLELHKPDGGPLWSDCLECSCDGALAATDCHQTVRWPCPTVRDIAKGLGIEQSE